MRNSAPLIAFLSIALFLCVLKLDNDKRNLISQLNTSKRLLIKSDSLSSWRGERLKLYVPICLEQNKLIKNKPQRLKELEYQLTEGVK